VSVKFDAIAKPDKKFADTTAPLKAGLEHEQYVTSLINNIYNEAFGIKDFKTMQFLDWFIKEQGEEEKNAAHRGLDRPRRHAVDADAERGELDRELLSRVYAPSTTGPSK